MKQEMNMSIHELTALAARLSSITAYAEELALTREEILEEVRFLAWQLRQEADKIDLEMDRQFLQEYA